MPELPEVETVVNSLKPLILNQTISDVEVFYSKIIKNVSASEFISDLKAQTFLEINRNGKYLIFTLTDYYLISHLRMEGKFYLKDNDNVTKHEHIVFKLGDKYLTYADTRKFGTMFLYKKSVDIYHIYPLNTLGYEPFNPLFTVKYLADKFQKTARPIKTVLLDQSIVAGLGNIYVDEVLFMAKIHPLRKAKDLNDEEIEKIIFASRSVLKKAISLGGTTIRSFTINHDISGRFQNELQIHTKEECPICHQKVNKIYVGGRGTYFCSHCQVLTNLNK